MTVYAMALGVTLASEEYDEVKSTGAMCSNSHMPQAVDDILASMITLEPEQRPTARDIYERCLRIRENTGDAKRYRMRFKDFAEA